jgi:(1->4)-alpha-D-glucan 1-alpha-D-glucosylmutase
VSGLDELAARCGIADGYDDYRGEHRRTSPETRCALLTALGHAVSSEAEVEAALRRVDAETWREGLPGAVVVRVHEPCALTLTHTGDGEAAFDWTVDIESGVQLAGRVDADAGTVIGRRSIDGRSRVRRRLVLPLAAPTGYHRLRIRGRGIDASTSLIIAPQKCHVPDTLDRRRWGLAAQLYTLRSAQDWGMGDFGDLRRLVANAAAAGADFVGLNPIHALYPARPAHCSPYAPSSRVFVNVFYIDVAAVPDFDESPAAQALVADERFRERVGELRAGDLVDYPGVAALKLPVLRALHASFRAQHLCADTERARAFRAFVAAGGQPLARHALFDSLCTHFGGRGWTHWPAAWRDPASPEVSAFARDHAGDLEFYEYLQWIADEQLAAIQAAARARGMSIGLYRDQAVGVDAEGADAWAAQELYRSGASVGAPPDALALQGQDWGLPPPDPRALVARGYDDFVQLLRANMRHCGALRIDHVMSMLRLWWVPAGASADAGAYVEYPFEDLLGIVALESARNRCVVIGEDLGTVPDRVRNALPATGLLSYRVLYFEKDDAGRFRRPADYPSLALATVTTHDLPPISSYWDGADLALRERLDLYPTEDVRRRCHDERVSDRKALLGALAAEGLLPQGPVAGSSTHTTMTFELAAAIHVYLARSRSWLMSVQAEDLLLMCEPVNLPGTSEEHPNWQRKLASGIEALFATPRVQALCRRLNAERGS